MSSTPENLRDLYIDELKDLWSANDQMARAIKKIAKKVSDASLKEMMTKTQGGIERHTELLKELIVKNGEKASKEHCKGMEGLVDEAKKHAIDEAPDKGPVLDAVIIAQYQRMTHYGIAGFGTAASYAGTLGLTEDQQMLEQATKEIYGGDEYATKLAEVTVNIDAKAE